MLKMEMVRVVTTSFDIIYAHFNSFIANIFGDN